MVPESVLVETEHSFVTQFFPGDWNLSVNLSVSSSLLDLLIIRLFFSWFPKSWISSSAILATCRSQLAMLTVLCTRENPEHILPKASQPSPRKPARNLWKFPELASCASHLRSRAGDPLATFQTHRANSCLWWNSHFPFLGIFWYFCMSRASQL